MLSFAPLSYPYTSRRDPVYAARGRLQYWVIDERYVK